MFDLLQSALKACERRRRISIKLVVPRAVLCTCAYGQKCLIRSKHGNAAVTPSYGGQRSVVAGRQAHRLSVESLRRVNLPAAHLDNVLVFDGRCGAILYVCCLSVEEVERDRS